MNISAINTSFKGRLEFTSSKEFPPGRCGERIYAQKVSIDANKIEQVVACKENSIYMNNDLIPYEDRQPKNLTRIITDSGDFYDFNLSFDQVSKAVTKAQSTQSDIVSLDKTV